MTIFKLWNFHRHGALSYACCCFLLLIITTTTAARTEEGSSEQDIQHGPIIEFYPEKLSIFQFKHKEIAVSFRVNSTDFPENDHDLDEKVEKPVWLQCPGEVNIVADDSNHLKVINGTGKFNVTPADFYNFENFTVIVRAKNLGYSNLLITWTSLVPLDLCEQALYNATLSAVLKSEKPKNITNLSDITKATDILEVLTENEEEEEDLEDMEEEEEEATTTTTKKPRKKPKKPKKPKKDRESESHDDYFNYLKQSKEMAVAQVDHATIITYDFSKNGSNYRYQVTIFRDTGTVDMLFVILVTACVALNTLFMGCQVDLKVIIGVLKKPIGPAVGFVSQFVFMPVASYILSQILFTESNYMLGLFALGCSPGGSGSNFWTLLLGGDLNLSVTMTFISTVCCIFMMPFWLFTLGQSILRRGRVSIPFSNLVFSLVAFTVPLGLGLLIQRLRPTWAKFATKLIKPFTFFIIIAFNGLAIWNNMYVFRMMTWQMVVGGIGIAWGGYMFGATAAWLFKQGKPQIIAISIETAIQNPGVTFMILRMTLPQPDADMSTVAPVAQIFVTNMPLFLIYFIYRIVTVIRNRCCKTETNPKEGMELENLQPLVGDRIADQKNRDSRPPELLAWDPSLKSKRETQDEPRYVAVQMYSSETKDNDMGNPYISKPIYPVELSSASSTPVSRYKDPVYQNF